MSVPILYAGSQYHPVPFVPIPPPPPPPVPPQFSAAEIGAVNAFTLPVTFDQNVSASDYAAGVTIKVNGTATSITSATRQANHAIVRYVIPILWHGSADVVTWEYAQASGNIVAETGGMALGDVTAQSVTNNCEYAALLDLQADALALSDADPVSTWADQSGAGRDFTQTGDARPTKQTVSTYPAVVSDGTDDWMDGGEFADNLGAFTIVAAGAVGAFGPAVNPVISKINNINDGAGWSVYQRGSNMITQEAGGSVYFLVSMTGFTDIGTRQVWSFDFVNKNSLHNYTDSIENTILNTSDHGPVVNMSTAEPMRLFANNPTAGDGFGAMTLHGVLFLAPRPSATNRAALEARLAARYGITL